MIPFVALAFLAVAVTQNVTQLRAGSGMQEVPNHVQKLLECKSAGLTCTVKSHNAYRKSSHCEKKAWAGCDDWCSRNTPDGFPAIYDKPHEIKVVHAEHGECEVQGECHCVYFKA